jgi:hypothetical protein
MAATKALGEEVNARMASNEESRKDMEPMEVKEVGHVGEVLQGGGGKLTPSPNDPGEVRKPKGSE